MIRNLKALGLVVVAMLAMTALVASTASASKLTAGASSGKLTATQVSEHVFTFTSGTTKCPSAHQEGSYTSASIEEMTLAATLKSCKAGGLFAAEVKMNGCTFTLSGVGQVANTATMQIVCPGASEITVLTAICTVHVEPQSLTGHIVFENEASDVKATYTFEGIKYTETTGCPNVEKSATTSNGTFTGSTTVKATNTAGEAVSLSAD